MYNKVHQLSKVPDEMKKFVDNLITPGFSELGEETQGRDFSMKNRRGKKRAAKNRDSYTSTS